MENTITNEYISNFVELHKSDIDMFYNKINNLNNIFENKVRNTNIKSINEFEKDYNELWTYLDNNYSNEMENIFNEYWFLYDIIQTTSQILNNKNDEY